MKKVNIIGSGFASLAAASYLADAGLEVHVYEKNAQAGGRARQLKEDGFTFDMGPSWYWMPDVFERFFNDFNRTVSDFYDLVRLAPGYRVYFKDGTSIEIPDNLEDIERIFEEIEPGSGRQLKRFMADAEENYAIAIKDLVYKPGLSPLELVTPKTVGKVNQFFSSIRAQVHKRFKNEKLRKILEFPVLFLGAKPEDTPAFYNFMNQADFSLGTWYPMGGMYKVVEAMVDLAESLGVKIHTNASVEKIAVTGNQATGLIVDGELHAADYILSGADYHHTEQLLDQPMRMYSEKYWDKKTFAPSALLYYLGFNKKFEGLKHHMLFFDEDFDAHAKLIYDQPAWPENPLFYASFPSITDPDLNEGDRECATLLIPLAPDLPDDEETRTKYLWIMLKRLEKFTGQDLKSHLVYSKSYAISDFKKDYNSYKGNAYGMANTLLQTAFLRPGLKSKKVKHLYFTGQLTVPGPGVPPSLISGKLAAELLIKENHLQNKSAYETAV
ncbi:phytoene desaturase [bacterium]|nr:phytoene desaturase [bacterium]